MRRHLRVARRLHLGARRRGRCRIGPLFCRDRVRYGPTSERGPLSATRLPSPVGRPTLLRLRVDAVGPSVSLAPPLGRTRVAARAHRRARPAEHVHPSTPTTPPKSTVHPPLLLGAAGRPWRPCTCFHAAARFDALAAKARVARLEPSPSPARDLGRRPRESRAPAHSGSSPARSRRLPTPPVAQSTEASRSSSWLPTGPPQAPTGFQSPPLDPPSHHLHPNELLV